MKEEELWPQELILHLLTTYFQDQEELLTVFNLFLSKRLFKKKKILKGEKGLISEVGYIH